MRKEFIVDQSNALIKDGKIFDLHNSYEFTGIVLKGQERLLKILFKPTIEQGGERKPISIIFEFIDFLELSPNFGTRIISGLDEIGYKSPTDRDDEWLLDEQQSTPDDHLFFRMDNDDYIRVHCQHCDVCEKQDDTIPIHPA